MAQPAGNCAKLQAQDPQPRRCPPPPGEQGLSTRAMVGCPGQGWARQTSPASVQSWRLWEPHSSPRLGKCSQVPRGARHPPTGGRGTGLAGPPPTLGRSLPYGSLLVYHRGLCRLPASSPASLVLTRALGRPPQAPTGSALAQGRLQAVLGTGWGPLTSKGLGPHDPWDWNSV